MELRPRFQDVFEGDKSQVMERFKKELDVADHIKAAIWDHHIVLKIPSEEQHYWSPQLLISFEQIDDTVHIRGLCGPKPSVWMMFVFFYFLLGFVAVIVMITGFAQMNLGLPSGVLWLLPAIAFIVLMIYLTARMGQKMAKDEMIRLYEFYHHAKPSSPSLLSGPYRRP